MPGTNARGHKIPLGAESSINRATIFQEFGESIRDVVPVANVAARTALVAALTTAGEAPSTTKPLYVYRHDAPGMHRLEWSVDGTVWIPVSGVLVFADVATRDAWTTANSSYLTIGDRARIGSDEYRWTGATWIAGSGGMFRLTPSAVVSPAGAAVTGASIGPLGEVIFAAVAASAVVQIRGIFSPLFKHYRLLAKCTTKSGVFLVHGIVGSAAIAAANYSFTRAGMVVGGAIAANQFTGQLSFGDPIFSDGAGGLAASTVDIMSPNAPEATQILSQIGLLGGATGVINVSANLNTADQLTGLQITCPVGGVTSAEFRFYGIA